MIPGFGIKEGPKQEKNNGKEYEVLYRVKEHEKYLKVRISDIILENIVLKSKRKFVIKIFFSDCYANYLLTNYTFVFNRLHVFEVNPVIK